MTALAVAARFLSRRPSLASILVGLVATSAVIGAVGTNPLTAYWVLVRGAVGSAQNVLTTLQYATPVILSGLGVWLALRLNFFNLGAEGSINLAGFAAGVIATIPALAFPGGAVVVVIAASLIGALWVLPPLLMKVYLKTSEIVVTILLNFVSLQLTSFLLARWFQAPGAIPRTAAIPDALVLPHLARVSNLNAGILIALALALFYQVYFRRSALFFKIRAVGANPVASWYAGFSVRSIILWTIFTGAFISSIAGACEALGVYRGFQMGFGTGLGWDGLTVALLGQESVIGVVIAGLFWGALHSGGLSLQIETGLPVEIILVFQGILVILLGGIRLRKSTTPHS